MIRWLRGMMRRLVIDLPERTSCAQNEETARLLREAERKLAETKALGAVVSQVADESRTIRRQNNFSRRIADATRRFTRDDDG
jgi:hypothetical protein